MSNSKDKVIELNRESLIQRVIRDNALAAMLLSFVLLSTIYGIIIGVGIAVLVNQSEKYDALRSQYELNSVWHSKVSGELAARGFKLPDVESKEEKEE